MAPPSSAVTEGQVPLLTCLKQQTQHLHDQIEQVVPLMRPDLDRAGYGRYLSRLLGFLRPLEERLATFATALKTHGLDFEARRKCALLVKDLGALGWSAAAIENLPRCTNLPHLDTLSSAWGCLYVLEGSTLGGQVIQRTLGPRLQLSTQHGLGFLVGYGESTGSSWKAFAAATQRFEAHEADRAAAVRGARETFSLQMAWLAHEAALG